MNHNHLIFKYQNINNYSYDFSVLIVKTNYFDNIRNKNYQTLLLFL